MDMLNRLKSSLRQWRSARWQQQKDRQLERWAGERHQRLQHAVGTDGSRQHLVFVCEEFFHPDLRGYGGFGKTVKNIADYFNARPQVALGVALAYPQGSSLVSIPEVRSYHNTPVVLRPYESAPDRAVFEAYGQAIEGLAPRLLITIDWYPSYAAPVCAMSRTPLLIWIHDPRDREEWEKIAGVADELKFRGLQSSEQLVALAHEKAVSIGRLFALARTWPRKIVFATTARTLVPRAERTYEMGALKVHWLPNPLDMPALGGTEEAERPTLLYLGRMDAVKRPWIAFELARRHPQLDVVIAGQAHVPELMQPWLERYQGVPNLKFLGHVEGAEKDRQLRRCWALLNTSVHEAEPVSFLEAFSYGKCVLGCHDPDSAVTEFGYHTGEVLGEGLDEEALGRYARQIERLLGDAVLRHDKGRRAREEMLKNHTFDSFERHLSGILKAEGI